MAINVEDIALMVAWRERGDFQCALVDTAAAVTDYLRGLIVNTEQVLHDSTSRRYSIEADLELGEHFTVPLEGREEEAALRSLIVGIDRMDQVGSRDLPEKPLTFYAVIAGDRPANRTAYLRKTNPMKVAKPGWGLFEFGETLATIANPVFVVENVFDLILRPDSIAIMRPNVFESLFYEMTGVDAKIRTWVRNISKRLPMDRGTLDLISDACRTQPRLRRRLQAIQERGHIANVTLARFRQELRRHNFEVARFIRNGVILAGKSDYGLLLQVLNEDLFRGGLTDEEFAAERKVPRSP